MRLLIISRTPHHIKDGQVVGHGPTVREISYLGSLFDEVRHIGDLHPGEAPALEFPYEADNIELIPVDPGGGNTLRSKFDLLLMMPGYISKMLRELPKADVVHVRCPAGISLYAIVLLSLVWFPKKRWIKYAGNWKPARKESIFYTFQRWWLQHNMSRANVTVNGHWDDQPPHITTFLNPCLTEEQLTQGAGVAQNKTLDGTLKLLYVGNVNTPKGVGRAVEIVSELKAAGHRVHFDVVGDGPERPVFEEQAAALGVADEVTFHSWQPRNAIDAFYADAHVMLMPTDSSEGWPKVLSEAMAYGVVPVTGAISSIPQYLEQFGTGRALPPLEPGAFVAAITEYIENPATWERESLNGVAAAHRFSFEEYLKAVRDLLQL